MNKITPDQAHYVLQTLLSSGAVRAAQVDKVLRDRQEEIRSLRDRLLLLEKLSGGSPGAGNGRRRGTAKARRKAGAAGGRRGPRTRRARRARRAMSPKTLALRKLQGRYMGYVRGLKPAEKARVREVREKQGMNAAITLASSLGGRK